MAEEAGAETPVVTTGQSIGQNNVQHPMETIIIWSQGFRFKMFNFRSRSTFEYGSSFFDDINSQIFYFICVKISVADPYILYTNPDPDPDPAL